MNKKVIIFIPSIEEGGVEKNLFVITNYLQEKNINIEILTCNNNKKNNFYKGIKFIGTKSKFWQNKNRKIKYLICLFLLFLNLIKKKQKTLVFAFQANIYAIIVAKILNTKIITRSNSSPSGWSKNFFKRKLYSFLINLADDVMVNSLDFKKDFYRNFKIKTECIYNPFDKLTILEKIKKKNKNKLFKKKSLKILSVGRLTDQKDHLTLLKSAKLIDLRLNPKIIIIGKGIKYNFLKNYIKNNNLQNIVKLIGYQSNPFIHIKSADILVLTSKFEGLPNILLEGQFLKKYIISTDCPTGPREILMNGRAGDLFKVADYKKLAKIINNYPKNTKIISNKIKYGTKNFYRFNQNLNCKKYLNFVNRNF